MVVTDKSLHLLSDVGVSNPQRHVDESQSILIESIAPGMDFIDGIYIMRVHEIHGSAIHAK